MKDLRIDSRRLWHTLERLGEVGAYDDPGTGLRGVNRLALGDADAAGRRLVISWMEAAGLEVRVDQIGNVYGRRAGLRDDLAPMVSGSHLDSVPTGGRFDGALGVLAALEAVRSLDDAGYTTERPLEVGFFTDEEGARFGTDMLGSGVAAGRIPLEEALAKRDPGGVSVGEELERLGFAGPDDPLLRDGRRPYAFVELHVEQGPVLEAAGVDLGVVTGVQAISWHEVVFRGKSAHAGTTPMALRSDAGGCAARLAVLLDEMARSGRYGAGMRATVGRLELWPNKVNIVPARALMTVDLRNPDEQLMQAAEAELRALVAQIAGNAGAEVELTPTARTLPVVFDARVQRVISAHASARGATHEPILSGAGHDAQEFAAVCPTGMIFVPGRYDGISHNPREWSTPEACALGAQVLLDTLVELASETGSVNANSVDAQL